VLAPGYLQKEINRLRFEPAPADQRATVIPISAAATASGPSGTNKPVDASAGGASEPPLPADLHPRHDASESPKDVAELHCRGERI
jgi:hypothetical protein